MQLFVEFNGDSIWGDGFCVVKSVFDESSHFCIIVSLLVIVLTSPWYICIAHADLVIT